MTWLQKLLPPKFSQQSQQSKSQIPEGLWSKCENCQDPIYTAEFEKNLRVCSKCGFHHQISARARLATLFEGKTTEIAGNIVGGDPLKFKDTKAYTDRTKAATINSGETEAIVVQSGNLKNIAVTIAAFEYNFIGGSMGLGVGERFAQGVKYAAAHDQPFVCFTASGGARMQEGLLSLMQMAKTTAALHQLADKGLPFINVLTNPTMGGVSASFAMIADIIIAEPQALVGFAGPRVIEQTVREKLPDGFQRSEFLLEKGAIDLIVPRLEMRDKLAEIIGKLLNVAIDPTIQ